MTGQRVEEMTRDETGAGAPAEGGIVEREASINVSNLMVICSECDRPTRSRHKLLADGRKVRVCHRCEGVIDK